MTEGGNCGETRSPREDPLSLSPAGLRVLKNTIQEWEEFSLEFPSPLCFIGVRSDNVD